MYFYLGLVSDASKEQETSLDDFEIAINEDDQQALDDFLGPDDGGLARETVAMAAGDTDDEEEGSEESEEEEVTSETEEEERVDVTKMVESRTEAEDRIEGTEQHTEPEKEVESSHQEVTGKMHLLYMWLFSRWFYFHESEPPGNFHFNLCLYTVMKTLEFFWN